MADGRKKYRSDLKEHKITVKVSETERSEERRVGKECRY